MSNLASLFLDRAARRPEARFGVVEEPTTLAQAVSRARSGTGQLARAGVEAGNRVAVIGDTGMSYLIAFLTLQLAGVEAALVNPALPNDLIQQMLDNLKVSTVLWIGHDPSPEVAPDALHLDASDWASGRLRSDGGTLSGFGEEALEGLARRPQDIAGYMHTSGTTGPPKFCARAIITFSVWAALLPIQWTSRRPTRCLLHSPCSTSTHWDTASWGLSLQGRRCWEQDASRPAVSGQRSESPASRLSFYMVHRWRFSTRQPGLRTRPATSCAVCFWRTDPS